MRIPIFSYVANRQEFRFRVQIQSQRYGQHSETVSSGRVRETGGAISWVVHRLDQPVQGVIVFAKTKQAKANLSSQIADRKGGGQVVKRYCAVVRRNADVYKETETAKRISGTDGLSSERPQDKHFLYCAKGNERCKRKQTALCDPGRNRGSQPGRYRTSDRPASSDPCTAFRSGHADCG